MTWFFIFIPVVATIILLVFFTKKVSLLEIFALIVPSALLILLMNTIMVAYRTSDTEYFGSYTTKVIYYEEWDEEVSCRHSYDCNCSTDKDGRRSCSTCYEHAYDVDYHPEHWTKKDNLGREFEITKTEFLRLQERFATKPYFVDLHRDYHSIDGNSYVTDFAGQPEKSDVLTTDHSYTNKIMASHSVFKFEDINEKTKKIWSLYDYPKTNWYYQPIVLGYSVDQVTERKLQFINGLYGSRKQFRMYLLFFKDKSVDVAFKQRSYWEGGNKNEFVICIGLNKENTLDWVKCFSWSDKPELEAEVEEFFNDNKKIDLNKFADWMPRNVEQHWHRKQFKDFDYLQIELTDTQMWWVLIIILIYNIGASIWIVVNEFENISYTVTGGDDNFWSRLSRQMKKEEPKKYIRPVKKSNFQKRLEELQKQRNKNKY